MLSILRKVKGLNCRDLYFYHDLPDNTIGEDVQYFVQAVKLFPHADPFFTTIADLRLDEDSISKVIKKGFSYEIRRARDKDFVAVTVLNAPNDQDIERFALFYDSFSNSKNLANSNKQKLKELAKNSALVLSASSVEQKEGVWLSAHAYICDGQRARLLYSASNVSLLATDDRQLVGRANKYMHWHLMMHFKANGFHEYDFGGISKLPELKHIDEFKEAFGGREVLEFNLVKGVSTKGKIAVLVFRVKNKLKTLL